LAVAASLAFCLPRLLSHGGSGSLAPALLMAVLLASPGALASAAPGWYCHHRSWVVAASRLASGLPLLLAWPLEPPQGEAWGGWLSFMTHIGALALPVLAAVHPLPTQVGKTAGEDAVIDVRYGGNPGSFAGGCT
jgi:hypothetical protein